ncbi:NADH-quinone oxidoreductase subunit L [Buchananella hordeovulneris]|uniref:NADH-quinone oxidoreductase subunit L n=1 Tax=Buchananella hordeovulneris TaxID=52770 RepID=UPI0026DCD09D|nr:NADH-quinone oxidoreductase subunit L [Buchananella hordeovulneris]MDO5081020.1 NADH-quinone oxidoreductase subunit L [Buchananella hordeovulneris]
MTIPLDNYVPGVAAVPLTGAAAAAWLVIIVPLISALALLLAGRKSDKWGHWLAVAASTCSAGFSLLLAAQLLGLPAAKRVMDSQLLLWFSAGDVQVGYGLRIDPLSVTFALLVTIVGTLIHIYAVAYMAHDKDRRRFFAYLNLFIAAMLTLVLANSYTLLFVGWEGVGLASYLLIGFWNFRPDYAAAAKKAFVMNRVGDVGLLLAMGVMFATVGSTAFTDITERIGQVPSHWVNAIGFFLLLAACGKSAQVPLQAWLGDAMAGPTPVSALIHAATMVTAGVYLMVRSAPIYLLAPGAALAVAIVGAITLLFGAIVGSAKDDLKKVLAASTMSQLGYMMLAAGLGPVGYAFAIFHLLTHGFFKALMFLGAGSVMHGMNDQVDMRRFGGLRTAMKITWATFAVGWLAILGVPPFAGFWSKDKIIEAAFVGDGARPWIFGTIALVGAGITAFYMSRLFFMTFYGARRWTTDADTELGGQVHPHESGALMTVPMLILAAFSVVLGGVLTIGGAFTHWLEPAIGSTPHVEPVLPIAVIMGLTLALVVAGAALAWQMYGRRPVPLTPPDSVWAQAARRDLYADALNENLFMRPGQVLTNGLVLTDQVAVDGAVTGTARAIAGAGKLAQATQNGYVRAYAVTILLGVAVALAVVFGVSL